MKRGYTVIGGVYISVAAALIWSSSPAGVDSDMLLLLILLAFAVVYMDRWVNWIAPRVQWSYGSVFGTAAMVLTSHGDASLVGACFGLLGGLTDQEFSRLKLGRLSANSGQLAITGWISGFVLDLIRPESVGPSLGLVLGVIASSASTVALSGFFVIVAYRYTIGTWPGRDMIRSGVLLGWMKLLPSVAIAAIASTVSLLGSAWMLFAAVQMAALGAIPIVQSKLEARRRDVMATVTSALNARGVVGTAHDHLEATALSLGHRLGLTADQLEQLRYLALLYAMTDHFAGSLPRSFEDQLRGLKENEFSSALLLGLPVNDIADARVVRIAEAAAEYEALIRPIDGTAPLSSKEAAADLLRSGTRPEIVAALLDDREIPRSSFRAWALVPSSPWLRSVRWLARRPSF